GRVGGRRMPSHRALHGAAVAAVRDTVVGPRADVRERELLRRSTRPRRREIEAERGPRDRVVGRGTALLGAAYGDGGEGEDREDDGDRPDGSRRVGAC